VLPFTVNDPTMVVVARLDNPVTVMFPLNIEFPVIFEVPILRF